MDFNVVTRQIIIEHEKLTKSGEHLFDVRDCIEIFRYYYQKYYEVFGVDHPHITNKTVNNILGQLPYTDRHNDVFDFVPEDYQEMIDCYFKQTFRNCNYSISHFMSGEIRNLRVFEIFG